MARAATVENLLVKAGVLPAKVPVKLDKIPGGARAGRKLRYSPAEGKFMVVGKRTKKGVAEVNKSQK